MVKTIYFHRFQNFHLSYIQTARQDDSMSGIFVPCPKFMLFIIYYYSKVQLFRSPFFRPKLIISLPLV